MTAAEFPWSVGAHTDWEWRIVEGNAMTDPREPLKCFQGLKVALFNVFFCQTNWQSNEMRDPCILFWNSYEHISVKSVSWKSTIMMSFQLPIFDQQNTSSCWLWWHESYFETSENCWLLQTDWDVCHAIRKPLQNMPVSVWVNLHFCYLNFMLVI